MSICRLTTFLPQGTVVKGNQNKKLVLLSLLPMYCINSKTLCKCRLLGEKSLVDGSRHQLGFLAWKSFDELVYVMWGMIMQLSGRLTIGNVFLRLGLPVARCSGNNRPYKAVSDRFRLKYSSHFKACQAVNLQSRVLKMRLGTLLTLLCE